MHKHSLLSVSKHFSRFPAGRFKTDSNVSGEAFRELLVKKLTENDTVMVLLDDTMGFGSSWLEEAFGGLVTNEKFTASDLRKKLTVEASDTSLVTEIWEYINKDQ
jgi:hypothetical protein